MNEKKTMKFMGMEPPMWGRVGIKMAILIP